MKILYDIALNVNDKVRSKNAFLNESIHEIIENLAEHDKLSLVATANKERLVKRLSTILDRKEINLQDDLSNFIASFKSVYTRTTYTYSLKTYLEYCDSLNIDPRLAIYETARNFVLFLTNNGKSSVVIRQTISIVKSFYDYMLEINELNISNPFSHKALLPRQERIKPLVIPTQQEYDLIMSEYAMNDSKKALLYAFSIITRYGVRISAFHKASVLNHNLVRITDYKGKEQTIAFESNDIARLKRITRHYKTRECLEVSLIKFLKKCHKQGLTDNAYSPHDFRHLFACNFYKTTKDIVGLSVILNHTSIAVTDTYITDLKRSGNETRTIELVPSISEYNQILTKYKAYRKTDINTTLDALYFISAYQFEIDDFYTIAKTYKGNTFQIEKELSLVVINLTSKDIKRLETVTRHYKTRECLEVSLIKFLEKCHKQGLTDNAYSPQDFRHLHTCGLVKPR